MSYGIPYMGSKSRICESLFEHIPSGKRFVDLFGGGFSMSHYALICGKYEKVLYNDINPLVTNLVNDAIDGKYNYDCFKPEFITRQRFEELKDKDGYVKYIWSFGNDGNSYLYGREIESIKHKAHDFVIFGIIDKELLEIVPEIVRIKTNNIYLRLKQFTKIVNKQGGNCKNIKLLQNIRQLQRLQQLQRLSKDKLEISNISYEHYKYKKGDIVYCDIPYEQTKKYDNEFDNKKFYDWAAKQNYPIYFSSYKISDKRFKMIYAKRLNSLMCANNNGVYNFECLYWNGK